jgi:hypothetical protein
MKPQLNFMLCSHAVEEHRTVQRCFSSSGVFATMGLMSSLGVDVFNRFASMIQVE